MTTVHFFLESFNPRNGGMEESALRIVQSFAADSDVRFIAYVIGYTGPAERPREVARVIDIVSQMAGFIRMLGPNASISGGPKARLEALFLRNAVRREMQERPKDRHVMLSFYLSTAGFAAQQVAGELRMPHIACSRGSDLGHHLFMQEGIGPLEFVLQRATRVITTSLEHRRFVQDIVGRVDGVHAIYNALAPHVRPTWKRNDNDRVHLVSAGGYCFKKGTPYLLEAVARLLKEGFPIDLTIVGRTTPGPWEEIRRRYSTRYRDRMLLADMIDRGEMETFLLSGDVCCSASLSEGCPNAIMLALGLGLPIVSTATGALVDLAGGLDHVLLVPPASLEEFTEALRRMVRRILEGTLTIDTARLQPIIEQLSIDRERAEWRRVISEVAAGPGATNAQQPV